MNRWFRMYDEILDDPKVQKLPAEDFKAWVNLLCLANRNSGRLPSLDDIAFALRRDKNAAISLVERLTNALLIERRNGGPNGWYIAPHSWDKRQYKSDTSTERVKRFREKSGNVPETPRARSESEAESDSEEAKASPPISPVGKFDVFWKAFPHKIGKGAAKKSFDTAIKKTDLPTMLGAITAYVAAKPADRPWVNPATWLNQERWLDEFGTGPPKKVDYANELTKFLHEQENAECPPQLGLLPPSKSTIN